MIPLIDTHCHIDLCLEKSGESIEDFLVKMNPSPPCMIQVSCHPETLKKNLDLLDSQGVFGCFGVHPHEANLYNTLVENDLRDCLNHPKAVGFGEIGLDYHYDFSPRDIQKQVFQRQMELALASKFPIVLHTREAEDDTLEILKAFPLNGRRIHVHCYTGTLAFAESLLKLDAEVFFGFTGILTFKSADEIRNVALAIPEDRLLTETDSPYLAPIPHRGKDAHPGMVRLVLDALAKVRSTSLEDLAIICRENARRVYGI